jgi:hypothetical protein
MLLHAPAAADPSLATDFLYRTQHELGLLSLVASLVPAAMAFFMAGDRAGSSAGHIRCCSAPVIFSWQRQSSLARSHAMFADVNDNQRNLSGTCSSSTLCSRFTRLAFVCALCRSLLCCKVLHLQVEICYSGWYLSCT